jgi:hypothetical protein
MTPSLVQILPYATVVHADEKLLTDNSEDELQIAENHVNKIAKHIT